MNGSKSLSSFTEVAAQGYLSLSSLPPELQSHLVTSTAVTFSHSEQPLKHIASGRLIFALHNFEWTRSHSNPIYRIFLFGFRTPRIAYDFVCIPPKAPPSRAICSTLKKRCVLLTPTTLLSDVKFLWAVYPFTFSTAFFPGFVRFCISCFFLVTVAVFYSPQFFR